MKRGDGEFARRLARLLLRTFPAVFRGRFGEEMEASFAERWREHRARGRGALCLFALRASWDLISAGLAERFRPSTRAEAGLRAALRRPASFPRPGASLIDRLRLDLRFAVRSLLQIGRAHV